MKKWLIPFLCIVLLMPAFCFAENADAERLDEAMFQAFNKRDATGGVVVVAKDGRIVYEYCYGMARYFGGLPITMDSCFRTASVTKLVTAVHVMQLVEQGKLSLDTPIGEYLGYPVNNPYYPQAEITLRMVMSHTASFTEYDHYLNSDWNLKEMLYTGKGKMTTYNNYQDCQPGTAYYYSNFGAGITGCLIEATTGKNLNDSATELLFDPLGVNAAYHPSLLDDVDQVTDQFNETGQLLAAHSLSLRKEWDPGVNPLKHFTSTAGGLWIDGRGLCRIGMMLAGGGNLDGVTILQPETVQEMLSSQQGKGGITINSRYGLHVDRITTLVEGKMIYGHQGLSGNILCNLYFDPETDFVFVLISNGTTVKLDRWICTLSRECFGLAWDAFAGE